MCRVAPAAAEGLCVLEQYLSQTGLCKAATSGLLGDGVRIHEKQFFLPKRIDTVVNFLFGRESWMLFRRAEGFSWSSTVLHGGLIF